MHSLSIRTLEGDDVTPNDASIKITSLFPHIAVVDVILALDAATTAKATTLIVQGQPNVPSLRLLANDVPTCEYEVVSSDISNARLVIHLKAGVKVLTMQWHTSFVPIDETRMALKLPTVPGTRIEEQQYKLAIDWGTLKTSTTVVDGKGIGVVDKQLGVFDLSFAFHGRARESLAVFVSTGTSATGKMTAASQLVTYVMRASGIWIVSALLALVATFIYGRLYK